MLLWRGLMSRRVGISEWGVVLPRILFSCSMPFTFLMD
jgi:hypothetical protein